LPGLRGAPLILKWLSGLLLLDKKDGANPARWMPQFGM
jgi:hypothetical protein